MEDNDFRELLRRYLRGTLDHATARQVKAWYDSYGYSKDIKPLREKSNRKVIFLNMRDQIKSHIAYDIIAQKRKRRRMHYVAAMITLLLGVGSLMLVHIPTTDRFIAYDTVQSNAGQMTKVILPDSSTVWLNAGSRIRYQKQRFSIAREVFLDYGEAYFDVRPDSDRPFTVLSQSIKTQVLGTSFNIKNDPNLPYASVEVKTGKVAVSMEDGNLLHTLTAGHGTRYDRLPGTFTENHHFAHDAGSWVQGKIILNDADFNELASLFKNRFQVLLHTDLPQAEEYRYTLIIMQDQPLEEALTLISAIHGNKFRREKNNEVTIY